MLEGWSSLDDLLHTTFGVRVVMESCFTKRFTTDELYCMTDELCHWIVITEFTGSIGYLAIGRNVPMGASNDEE